MGQLDRVLEYLAFVAHHQPLPVLLDEAPRQIAACVGAEVASLYLLEGDGTSLVMRGNVGFPTRARGKVRLHIGEGITGKAVELMRPVTAASAPTHADYRSFPELDEDRFPAFAAVPILGAHGPLGAVVVQRGGSEPFTEAETTLLTALTAPISSALRMARLLDELRDKPPSSRRAGGGTRKVTLPGVPLVPGRALGAVAALRRPATTARSQPRPDDRESLTAAFDAAQRGLRALADLAAGKGIEEQFMQRHLVMLEDQRLRQRAFGLLAEGQSLAAALGEIARDAGRAANASGDAFLIERARDIEQLCDAVLMLAHPDSRATLPSKPVVVAEQLGIYDVLISVRSQPAAFVLTERAAPERTTLLLELMGVPAISDVPSAFRWSAPGDIALVDADHGFLILNPSRGDIAAHRADLKRERKGLSP
jgi:phosphotransferase system enzyme I (PtsP)